MNNLRDSFSLTNFRSLAGLAFVIILLAVVFQFGLTWHFAGHVQL